MLKNLKKYQERLLKSFKVEYRRYIFSDIDFDDKMIAIFGARGYYPFFFDKRSSYF